jgi:hypothetical protein
VPRSDSHNVTPARDDRDAPPAHAASPTPTERKQTPVFIVVSPRPQVGKTFTARLLIDFARLDGDDPAVFDLNPKGDALRDYLPGLAQITDLTDIKSQMRMFDRLIIDDGTAKVVDVNHTSFDRFFGISEEIGFFREASSRSIEAIILFAADPHPVAINAYADLQRRFRGTVLVPVFNDAILRGQKLRKEFPFTRPAAVPLQISVLAPMLKAQVDKTRCSFADLHDKLPIGIPIGLAFELRAWTRRTFLEFRELELRLLLEKLRASLPGIRL